MKVFLTVILGLSLTNAIRVPPTWQEGGTYKKTLIPLENNKSYKKSNGQFDVIHKKPHKVKPGLTPYWVKPSKNFNSQKNHRFNAHPKSSMANEWVPVTPFSIKTKPGYTPSRPKLTPNNLKQFYTSIPKNYVQKGNSPLHKNYRDDTTHENHDKDEYIQEFTTEFDRPVDKYTSDHEKPLDIPTKPLYPGEGAWSKPGILHRPYISKHIFSKLKDDSRERPDGYEIFEKGERLFDRKRNEFEKKSRKYKRHQTPVSQGDEIKEESSDGETREFVPMTLYTQVRRTENEEHLPSDSDDSEGGRLKEVIKDSRIHTVYTEEGYEDSAYDHAGHEKEAEDAQGYKEFKKGEDGENIPSKHQHDQDDASSTKLVNQIQPAASEMNLNKLKQNMNTKNKNKFSKSKATKTMKLKESPDGTKMEVRSEVKFMTSPGNENKTQQVIEIKPSIPDTNGTDHKLRRKRFTNDFPEIDVGKDFIGSITQSDLPKYNRRRQQNKYPYYQAKHLNQNSALRYSENLDNIPEKTEGKMAFYEQANGLECPEVDEDVEAVPKRIQEVEESVSNGEKLEIDEGEKSPRLGKLGQRIDCFKRKYFGENPLDSPFFKEKMIEPVPPLFRVFEEKSAGFKASHSNPSKAVRVWGNNNNNKKYHSKFSLRNTKNRDRNNNEKAEYERPNEALQERQVAPEVEVINVQNFRSIDQIMTETPHVSLLTTPDYSLDITPKNIYDQIELLDYLPSQAAEEISTTPKLEILRNGKLLEENSEQAIQPAQLHYRPNPGYPQYIHPRPHTKRKRPQPQFDMTSFLLSQNSKTPILGHRSFIKPNEIPYGDQIMPEDQLNVFADVINNIKNGTNDPLRAASSYQKTHEMKSVRIKVPPKKIHIKPSNSPKYLNDYNLYYLTTTTSTTPAPRTTKKSRRGGVRYSTTEADLYDDVYTDVDDDKVYGRKKKATTSTTSVPEPEYEEETEDAEVSENKENVKAIKVDETKSTKILGLVPPSKWNYRTIYQPVEALTADPEVSGSDAINTFYVVGMKPPATNQKVYHYNDFPKLSKRPNRYHKIRRRRGKRSPNRRSYFEVVRGQNSESSTATREDDDDYVPHRPKNYHWDEKLKKIIYDNPTEEEEAEEDVEVIEVEVEDSIPKNIQQTTTKRPFTSTTPLNGPSYVDFVKVLKNHKNYISIPDPTTTKDGITAVSMSTTTTKSEPTKPPEFLSIISKLRQSDSYKLIQDKNKTTTTTTEAPEEDDEESEDTETALSNIQNSPGRGAVDIGQNLKIFDVNDFLPKVKTYTPRTSIDYSKYKTIQRTPSRQPSDDEDKVEIVRPQTREPPKEQSTTQGMVEIIELSRRRPTTEAVSTTSTTIRPQRIRGRRPSTTPRTSTFASSNQDTVIITAQLTKPKRVYPRRRPSHIRSRTTTERLSKDSSSEETQKVIRRRHNTDETSDPKTKIISLESIIMSDKTNNTKYETSNPNAAQNVSIDDVLKNINLLKEVNIEDVPSDDIASAKTLDVLDDEEDSRGEDFDDDHEINFDSDNLTDRRLVISKDNGMYEYYYTPVQ